MTYSNRGALSLPIASWLATDTYVKNEDIISATQLCKSVRQVILIERIKTMPNVQMVGKDIMDMMASRDGTAIHESIERHWTSGAYRIGFQALGVPSKSTDLIVVNPKSIDEPGVHVYTEHGVETEAFDGYYMGGTADMIYDGILYDFKNTKTYGYKSESKIRNYAIQGSVYRASAPEKITSPTMIIVEKYSDWMQGKSFSAGYPPERIIEVEVNLMSINETKHFAKNKIQLINKHWNDDDSLIPLCDDADLWRDKSVWKYYSKDSNVKAQATFDTHNEAVAHIRSKGGVGVIREVKGMAKACVFCDARPICGQAKLLATVGELK